MLRNMHYEFKRINGYRTFSMIMAILLSNDAQIEQSYYPIPCILTELLL